MRQILLDILPTILLLTILLGAFHQEVYVAPPPIPWPPHDQPPDLHFSILVEIHPWCHPIGHAFVQLDDSGTLYTYGFAASSWWKGLFSKPGIVRNDSQAPWDWKITWDITVNCWNLIAQWINPQISKPPNFQVMAKGNDYNCMKWAAAAAAQNGIAIQNYKDWLGIPDPSTFGKYLEGIGNGNTDPRTGGKVGQNTASVSPSTEPIFVGSYALACSMCLESPSQFALYFNATLDAASMGSYTATVGHPESFVSPVSVNLSETIVAWDFGDGSNDYQTLSTSHTYSSQGNYAVTFIAISENTVWSRTGTVTVSGGDGARAPLTIVYYSNPQLAYGALTNGEIDMMACPLDKNQYATAITDPNIVLGPTTMNDMVSFDLNCEETIAAYPGVNSPTSYWQFRAALALLTDKQYIVDSICGRFAGRMDVPIPANAPSWRNMSVIYPNYPWEYNPINAATLLNGAGFVEGTTTNTYYDSGFPGSARYIRVYPNYAVVHDNPRVDDLTGPSYSWTLTFTALSVLRVMGVPSTSTDGVYKELAYTFSANTVTAATPTLKAGTYLWIEYEKAHPKAGQDLDPIIFYARSDDSLMLAAGTLLSSNMLKAGIPVQYNALPSSGCRPQVMTARNYHIYTGYQLLDRYPTSMYELYHSSWWFPDGKNYVAPPSAIDPNYDTYLENIYYAGNIPAAILACQAAQSIHVMKAVTIPLWFTKSFYAWCSWLLALVNENGYGPVNDYTFQKAYKGAGSPEPNVIRVGICQRPQSMNILYAQSVYDYVILDRMWPKGQAVNPYDIGRDQPWIVQDWTPTTWVDPDDGATKSACIYWLREDIKWTAPVTGNYIRPFTAHDVEFSNMFSYAFPDGAHWINAKDIDHIQIVDDYTYVVYFSANGYWLQFAANYPYLPKNEWGALFCTPAVYTEPDANYAAGDSLYLEGDLVAQVQSITVNGVPFTDYWVRFNSAGGVYSANRIYFTSAVSGNLVINYWNIAKSAKGYFPGSDTEWIPTSYSCGPWVPVYITKDVGAVFKRNDYFWMTTPSLGEIDWYWYWGSRDISRPLGGPCTGCFLVDIYDVVYATVSYGSSGYLEPTTFPPWFPGADLAPSYTLAVPYGGWIDIYDVTTILVCYGREFGEPPI